MCALSHPSRKTSIHQQQYDLFDSQLGPHDDGYGYDYADQLLACEHDLLAWVFVEFESHGI